MDKHLLCQPMVRSDRPTPGSIVANCSACTEPVWLAKAGQTMLKDGNVKILCVPCGMALHAADPDPRFEMAPGALAEIEQLLGKAGAEAAVRSVANLNRASRRARRKGA